MIRLGVLSDTHGEPHGIDLALDAIGEVDAYLHLGDVVSDAERISSETGKPFYAVRGNCDTFFASDKSYVSELVVEFEGAKLLMVHGHYHEVDEYSTYFARNRAIELGCGALLYGHTHIPRLIHRDGIIVLNPGSTSRPRAGAKPACAVLEIDGGKLRAKIITL